MKVLIIDTTKTNMFVGLMIENNKQIAQVKGLGKHNETLLPCIDNLLTENNLTLNDVDVVAVNVGAGSFTGIRVGVSTVKGFMCALPNLKCVTFNSLELLAYSSNMEGEYKAVISAGATNLYVANCLNRTVLNQFHNTLEEFNENTYKAIVANIEEKEVLPISANNYVDELKYFDLIAEKVEKNEFCDANSLEPIYLRLSQAERELEAKENANKKIN